MSVMHTYRVRYRVAGFERIDDVQANSRSAAVALIAGCWDRFEVKVLDICRTDIASAKRDDKMPVPGWQEV